MATEEQIRAALVEDDAYRRRIQMTHEERTAPLRELESFEKVPKMNDSCKEKWEIFYDYRQFAFVSCLLLCFWVLVAATALSQGHDLMGSLLAVTCILFAIPYALFVRNAKSTFPLKENSLYRDH